MITCRMERRPLVKTVTIRDTIATGEVLTIELVGKRYSNSQMRCAGIVSSEATVFRMERSIDITALESQALLRCNRRWL